MITRRPIESVALALGLDPKRRRLPCPSSCSDDKRGTVTLTRDGMGWACHHCNQKGDSIEYVSYVLVGGRFRDLDNDARQVVRRWHGEESPAHVWTPPPVRAVVHADVSELWRACTPVGDHPFALERGLRDVPDHLARLTPLDTAWPEWWPAGRRHVWRLVTRGWTPEGEPVNLHGRAVVEPPEWYGRRVKTLWAKGIDAEELLFWNGRRSLDLVLVAEGLTDWLAAAVWAESRPIAVYGATSGGFAGLARLNLPESVPVVAMVDEDRAGDAYLAEIVEALPCSRIRRARASRFRPNTSIEAT